MRRRHPLALLALVAASGSQPLAREKAMSLLWPESDAERASNSLRQVLLWLRRDLGEEIFLPEGAGGLRLDPGLVRSDLERFRDALDSGMPEQAARLYRGAFMDGFNLPNAPEFAQWMEGERDRLKRLYVLTLVRLAKTAEEEGRHQEAVAWRRRHAAADPFSSRAALGLLKALAAAGDRPGALEYASVYEALVREHLETEPDPVVEAFVKELRDRPEVVVPVAAASDSRRSIPPGVDPGVRELRVAAEEDAAEVPDPEAVLAATSSDPVEWMAWRPPVRVRRARRLQLVGVVAVVGMLAAAPSLVHQLRHDPHAPLVLASATQRTDGRDTQTMLVECEGPACPAETLPQAAFAVPTHKFYADPNVGAGYIGPVADATMAASPGYECCTTAVFERVFRLPPDATGARITVSVLADNLAAVTINGQRFGRHGDPLSPDNYGQPATFSAAFMPGPNGINRLRVELEDRGGALGLYYYAVVTHSVQEEDRRR